MRYTYQEIRDVIFKLSESVYVANHKVGIITPMSESMGKILQNFLSQNNIRFSLESSISTFNNKPVPAIKFDLGQNRVIDITIDEMYSTSSLNINVNNRILRAMQYAPASQYERAAQEVEKKRALDELMGMVLKIRQATSRDGVPCYYLHFNDIEKAERLLQQLGVNAEKHFSLMESEPVLRIPLVMIEGSVAQIINELLSAIKAQETNIPKTPNIGGDYNR